MKSDTLLWLLGGAVVLLVAAGGGVIAMSAWKLYPNARKWLPTINSAEAAQGIPQDLLARAIYQESHWRDDIIAGTYVSSAGALGIAQLMPKYYASVRVPIPFTDADTAEQIGDAARTLASLYNQFGDWQLALAGYNAGAGRVGAYIAGTNSLPLETQNYVADIVADVPV